MRSCSARRYWGSAVFSANSLMVHNCRALRAPAEALFPPRAGRRRSRPAPLFALAEEFLDRTDDRVLVPDLARHDPLVLPEMVAQILDELAGPIGALHLAVGEHVHPRKDLLLH